MDPPAESISQATGNDRFPQQEFGDRATARIIEVGNIVVRRCESVIAATLSLGADGDEDQFGLAEFIGCVEDIDCVALTDRSFKIEITAAEAD